MEQHIRSERIFGKAGMERLARSTVAVFGLGGVGGAAVEALARGGVGRLILIDADTVAKSNLNRQLIALYSTVGMDKIEAARLRVLDIAPTCDVKGIKLFVTPDNLSEIDLSGVDFIIDCIDSVAAKLALAEYSEKTKTPLISSMGTGNKLDPTLFEITDISKTSVCPLARVMRTELRRRGIKHLRVLYSKETPLPTNATDGTRAPASTSFVPPVAGFILAGAVIRALSGISEN